MFDRPRLFVPSRPLAKFFGSVARPLIQVRNDQAEELFVALQAADYKCSVEKDLYHVDGEPEGISIIDLDPAVDAQQLGLWLRQWHA